MRAFVQPLLLKTDGAQDRTGGGSRFRVGECHLRLPIRLLEPPRLDQGGRPLQRLPRLGGETPPDEQKAGQQEGREHLGRLKGQVVIVRREVVAWGDEEGSRVSGWG